jgi:hypothetical protein
VESAVTATDNIAEDRVSAASIANLSGWTDASKRSIGPGGMIIPTPVATEIGIGTQIRTGIGDKARTGTSLHNSRWLRNGRAAQNVCRSTRLQLLPTIPLGLLLFVDQWPTRT